MTKMQLAQSAFSGLFSALSKGVFEIKKSANGQYFWVLKAANNQIICSSEIYVSKQSAKEGIASCMKNAANSYVIDKS